MKTVMAKHTVGHLMQGEVYTVIGERISEITGRVLYKLGGAGLEYGPEWYSSRFVTISSNISTEDFL